jgi:threonylcarbamoyladenosine tRNA methylthiotransferase MtaB
VAVFEALVAEARARIPGLTVTTDLIAGFPGETEGDFADTLAFARRMEFAHMHVFPYSARAGTAAARMAGQVPEAERRRRSRLLLELDAELGLRVRQRMLGQWRPVLWETPAGTEASKLNTEWEGLTDNYLRVRTVLPEPRLLRNCIVPTLLTQVEAGELQGEVALDRR